MKRAIKLAKRGYGFVSPNPMVGAVIVKNGQIIGEGFHLHFGGPHAEVNAINSVSDPADLVGSTIYITLQPCTHFGKTPPCLDLISRVGIAKIVYASSDPNPLVGSISGNFEVQAGVCKNEADFLIRKFSKFITTRKPYVAVKIGTTLDGSIADGNFNSKWITSQSARNYCYKLRAGFDAILVGGNTLRHDDPSLGLNGIAASKEPLRMVLSRNIVPGAYKFFRDSNYVILDSVSHFYSFCDTNNISSVLVEGGTSLYSEFVGSGKFDELLLFVAPKIIGSSGIKWDSKVDFGTLNKALELKLRSARCFDDTFMLKYLQK